MFTSRFVMYGFFGIITRGFNLFCITWTSRQKKQKMRVLKFCPTAKAKKSIVLVCDLNARVIVRIGMCINKYRSLNTTSRSEYFVVLSLKIKMSEFGCYVVQLQFFLFKLFLGFHVVNQSNFFFLCYI